ARLHLFQPGKHLRAKAAMGLHCNLAVRSDDVGEFDDLLLCNTLNVIARRRGYRYIALETFVSEKGLLESRTLQHAPDKLECERASGFLDAVTEHEHTLNSSRSHHGRMRTGCAT